MSGGRLLAQLFDPAGAGRFFDDPARLQGMLDFEAALARSQAALGVIPARRPRRSPPSAGPSCSTSKLWPRARPWPATPPFRW